MQQPVGQTWNGGHRFQMGGPGTTGPPLATALNMPPCLEGFTPFHLNNDSWPLGWNYLLVGSRSNTFVGPQIYKNLPNAKRLFLVQTTNKNSCISDNVHVSTTWLLFGPLQTSHYYYPGFPVFLPLLLDTVLPHGFPDIRVLWRLASFLRWLLHSVQQIFVGYCGTHYSWDNTVFWGFRSGECGA